MGKRVFLLITVLFVLIAATGCSGNRLRNRYPTILVDTGLFEVAGQIDMGSGYKYIGFDVSEVDSGKDVILHFKGMGN